MQHRFASIDDLPIAEHDRKFRWPLAHVEMDWSCRSKEVCDG
jgi:nuclear transport factor 2 (NTF2) superfamily protein